MTDAKREVVIPSGGTKPMGPYSLGIRAGGFLYLAGSTGVDPETRALVDGGVGAQATQALSNLSKVLEAAGSSLDKVVKTTVFMTNLQEFATLNEAYGQVFAQEPPARTTVQVVALPGGADVEIEAIAIVDTD